MKKLAGILLMLLFFIGCGDGGTQQASYQPSDNQAQTSPSPVDDKEKVEGFYRDLMATIKEADGYEKDVKSAVKKEDVVEMAGAMKTAQEKMLDAAHQIDGMEIPSLSNKKAEGYLKDAVESMNLYCYERSEVYGKAMDYEDDHKMSVLADLKKSRDNATLCSLKGAASLFSALGEAGFTQEEIDGIIKNKPAKF